MRVKPIKPQAIHFLTTTRCTASCDNCCLGCTPGEGRDMTLEEMKEYVDECLDAYPDTITTLDLTGGECMLLGKDVEQIFCYARDRGLRCSMVSNAFWATSYDKVLRTLRRLSRCGLRQVSFSTGVEHGNHVPWQNARHAAVAAARLGITVELRIEQAYGCPDIGKDIEADPEVIELVRRGRLNLYRHTFVTYSNRRPKERSWKVPYYDYNDVHSCRNLFEGIVIDPYGNVYPCCGLGMCKNPYLLLGNIHREPIKTIYERAFDDFLKLWIYSKGPDAVLKFVHEKTGQKFQWHSRHICDICRIIFTDKTILPVVRDNFYEIAGSVMLAYNAYAKVSNDSRTKR